MGHAAAAENRRRHAVPMGAALHFCAGFPEHI